MVTCLFLLGTNFAVRLRCVQLSRGRCFMGLLVWQLSLSLAYFIIMDETVIGCAYLQILDWTKGRLIIFVVIITFVEINNITIYSYKGNNKTLHEYNDNNR